MTSKLRSLHKYISLSLALFWFLQALTGVLLVFQYELDNARIDRAAVPFDPVAFGQGIARIEADNPGKTIPYIYTAGSGDRFDVYLAGADDKTDILRVDGDGRLLRTLPADHGLFGDALFKTALNWHETLFSGATGHVLVGISGIFLLSNIILGLKLAWPRNRQWRQAFAPQKARKGVASRYAWHRALGLGFAIPALAIVLTGVFMVWEDQIGDSLGADQATPAPDLSAATGGSNLIPLAHAIAIAQGQYPGARISIISPPGDGAPWYRLRLLQNDESRHLFGTTMVYVDAADGRVLADYDALKAPVPDRIVKAFYSIHTGDVLGTAGRVLVLVTGLWLVTMLTLGLMLWSARRKPRKKD
ncbi:PepSY-associated TM helix domain-containing protein [Govanella unica]|uniref:PepSY domain-containing protein n=1 Tax=Govanella unica TaxID=2975056 RepID=A0A9X3Z785_9PROT|nr:PepSY-associated TM helix domain-containing protein [Govania unica]MDA5193980.1 PepSY domain-containing protein [Govania unica]